MRKLATFLAAVSVLTFSTVVLADEGHPNSSTIKIPSEIHGGSTGHNEMPSMTPEEHQDMPMEHSGDGHGDTEIPNMTPEELQNMPSEHTSEGHGNSAGHGDVPSEPVGQGHGHGGPVIETPPNYKVLGTFGAINAAFILIGIWNKWFRRKETPACQA